MLEKNEGAFQESALCKNPDHVANTLNKMRQDIYNASFTGPSEEQKILFDQTKQLINAGQRPSMAWAMIFTLEEAQELMNISHEELKVRIKNDTSMSAFVNQIVTGKFERFAGLPNNNQFVSFALMRLAMEENKGTFPILAEIFHQDPNLFLPTRVMKVNDKEFILGDIARNSAELGLAPIREMLNDLKSQCPTSESNEKK